MKNNQNNIKHIAFNPYYILWLLGFGIALWGNIYLFSEKIFSWLLLIALLAFTAAALLDSVCYIFTKKEIYLVHFWGYIRRLPWFYVSSITKHNFWDSFGFRELMGYEVFYDRPYKGRLIRKSLYLALTPKVKKCLNKFYRGEITGETKPRKRKSK